MSSAPRPGGTQKVGPPSKEDRVVEASIEALRPLASRIEGSVMAAL